MTSAFSEMEHLGYPVSGQVRLEICWPPMAIGGFTEFGFWDIHVFFELLPPEIPFCCPVFCFFRSDQ